MSFPMISLSFISILGTIVLVYFLSLILSKIVKLNIKKISMFLLLVMILLFITDLCYEFGSSEEGIKLESVTALNKPNIIFFHIDALRSDRISANNYEQETTPNIDKIIKEGVFFPNCITPTASTFSAPVTWFTGKWPFTTGIRTRIDKLDSSEVILTEVLKEVGYRTAGFFSAWPYDKRYGLNQGFDIYDSEFNIFDKLNPRLSENLILLRLFGLLGYTVSERSGTQTNSRITSWLKEYDKEQPLFLFIHYFDGHMPYEPEYPFNEMYDPNYKGDADGSWRYYHAIELNRTKLSYEDIQHMVALYDGEISASDFYFGKIINELKKLDLYDNSIIIVTADHGESLGENNYYFSHGEFLYDPSIKVPLIIKYPKSLIKDQKINEIVRSIDIMPTILDLVGIKGYNTDGVSLNYYIGSNKKIDLIAYSEVVEGEHKSLAIRTNEWKYIRNLDSSELYNLKKDFKELNNIAKEYPDKVNAFETQILNLIKLNKKELKDLLSNNAEKTKSISEKEKEMIKALGYSA